LTETTKHPQILDKTTSAENGTAKASNQQPTAKSADVIEAKPTASPARVKTRHIGVLVSFALTVLFPILLSAAYLFLFAKDQYVSYVAFTIRSEDTSPASDLLGGLSAFGTSSSPDADILYEYIQSRELVKSIDDTLDLRALYAAPKTTDPVFAYIGDDTIEDMTDYWRRMVKIFYDSATGLIELRVHAFDAASAQKIAQLIYDDSTKMINDLSAIAREDATRYAREELERSVERLKAARQAMTEFRSKNLIVDPAAEIGSQTGLLTALQSQLSDAMISYDLLKQTSTQEDPRLKTAERRILVIQQRIEEERLKYGSGSPGNQDYSALVGEFESLAVDSEFSERAYLASLAAYDAALIEAQRQSLYLAAYIRPTLAEKAEEPKRLLLIGLIGVFALFAWSIGALVFYAIKDRR